MISSEVSSSSLKCCSSEKIKSRKVPDLNEIPTELWKTRKFNGILL